MLVFAYLFPTSNSIWWLINLNPIRVLVITISILILFLFSPSFKWHIQMSMCTKQNQKNKQYTKANLNVLLKAIKDKLNWSCFIFFCFISQLICTLQKYSFHFISYYDISSTSYWICVCFAACDFDLWFSVSASCCFLFLCGFFPILFLSSAIYEHDCLFKPLEYNTKQWIKLLLQFIFRTLHTQRSCVGENCFPFRRLLTDFMYQFAGSIIRFFFIIYGTCFGWCFNVSMPSEGEGQVL